MQGTADYISVLVVPEIQIGEQAGQQYDDIAQSGQERQQPRVFPRTQPFGNYREEGSHKQDAHIILQHTGKAVKELCGISEGLTVKREEFDVVNSYQNHQKKCRQHEFSRLLDFVPPV